jgi:O-antigen/teichoic acid export membrane protein
MQLPVIKQFKQSEVWRNLFKVLTSASIAQVIPLLIYPILTRIFNAEQFGLLALYQGICAVLIIPATGRYEFAIMIPEKDKDAWNLLGFGLLLGGIVSLLILVISVIFACPLAIMLGNPSISPWIPLISLSVLLTAIYTFFTFWANRKKEYSIIAGYTIYQSSVVSASKLGLGYAGLRNGGLIGGAIIGQFISSLWLAYKVTRKYSVFISKLSWKQMFAQAKRFSNFPKFRMLHALTNNLSGNLPVFILTSYFSPIYAGYWSLAFSVVYKPMSLFTNSLMQVFSQRMIERANQGLSIHKHVKEVISKMILAGIVPFILIGIAAPWIFALIFGKDWYTAGKYLQVMMPWLFTLYLAAPFSFIADLAGKQGIQFVLAFANFILRIIALAIGISTHNIMLALILLTIGGIATNLCYLFWYISLSKRQLRASLFFPSGENIDASN